MPFGSCNAPTMFQILVMYIFTDLLFKSMTVFMDDFNTQSNTNQHVECVREALNPDKTFLDIQRRVLLDYVVSEKGREPDPDKIAVIDGLATPTNTK